MRKTKLMMGMPITVEITDGFATERDINAVFDYFNYVDQTFSTYKPASEITKVNQGLIQEKDFSADMKEVFALSEKTRQETNGYFDILNNKGKYDPSGLVKGWAILRASKILESFGCKNFYVEAGGDIQVSGKKNSRAWKVGIKNPFKPSEVIKVVCLKNNGGIATSGSYERGTHIYNPKSRQQKLAEIVSLTVIGPDIYEADRFATAAFAMQEEGIRFIENLEDFEGYSIDAKGIATMTSNFEKYLC